MFSFCNIFSLQVPTLFEKHKPQPLFPSTPKRPDSKKATCNGIHSNVKTDHYPQFDWPAYLEEQSTEAAPVKCFHHVSCACLQI